VSGLFQPQDTTSSLYTHVFIASCDVNNLLFTTKNFLILRISLKRKRALLKSNPSAIKLMLIRIVKGVEPSAPFSLLSVSLMAKKTY
jgi:hypothetical protein